MDWKQRFYSRAPVFVQNAAVSLEGLRIRRSRFSRQFYQVLQEYQARSTWTQEEIKQFRDQRLRHMVVRAATRTTYYRELFRTLKLQPDDIRTLDDLQCLPIIDKHRVRDNFQAFIPDDLQALSAEKASTSGTTGAGLTIYVTPQAKREQWATWQRYRGWHGIEVNARCAIFNNQPVVPAQQARPPFWRYNRPGNQIIFSGFHLSRKNAPYYLDELERSGIQWMHGFPSLQAALASFAIDLNRRLSMRWITTGAENLSELQKNLIREAFGKVPIEHYGMCEGVANFSECPAGNLHIDEDFAAVEFEPGEYGHAIVGTNLTNDAFPLLRYRVGDNISGLKEPCSCGRPGRIVASVDGRSEDYIITRNGAYIGRLGRVFKTCTRIQAAQIYQREPGHIVVRVVRGEHYTAADEQLLIDELRRFLSQEVSFEIRHVDEIPRTKGGKQRFVVSDLLAGRQEAVAVGPR